MRELFDAVKADLLDRRLRALVIFVGILLLGAVAFVVLGGSSESATPTASAGTTPGAGAATPTLTQASTTNPKAAEAETTYGKTAQHHDKPVDPFIELTSSSSTTKSASASPATTPSSSAASASGKSSSSTSSGAASGGSSGSSGGAAPTPAAPTPPVKPKTHTVYHVNVELGPAPTAAGEAVHLTTYKHLTVGSKLPSTSHPLLVLKGASLPAKVEDVAGASATFGLLSSPIVNGPGKCLPSDTQCESVKMMNGQLEELQYAEENGQVVTYLLRVIGVFRQTVVG
jgi:hypothetical protein